MKVIYKQICNEVCVRHRESVSVTDSLCLSHTLCVSQTVYFCNRQSVTITIVDNPQPDLYLFIHDFLSDLSVRFEFVWDLGTHGSHFLDTCRAKSVKNGPPPQFFLSFSPISCSIFFGGGGIFWVLVLYPHSA